MDYNEYQNRVKYNQWQGYEYTSKDGTYTVERPCAGDPEWWVARTNDGQEITLHNTWLENDAIKQNWAK